jgi:hypothetical protein
MRLSIAYASAKVCRLAIESVDSLDYSVSGWLGDGARDAGPAEKGWLGEKSRKAYPRAYKALIHFTLVSTAEAMPSYKAFPRP